MRNVMKSKAEFPIHAHMPPQPRPDMELAPLYASIPNGVEMPLSRLPCSCRRHFPWLVITLIYISSVAVWVRLLCVVVCCAGVWVCCVCGCVNAFEIDPGDIFVGQKSSNQQPKMHLLFRPVVCLFVALFLGLFNCLPASSVPCLLFGNLSTGLSLL